MLGLGSLCTCSTYDLASSNELCKKQYVWGGRMSVDIMHMMRNAMMSNDITGMMSMAMVSDDITSMMGMDMVSDDITRMMSS